MQYWANYPNAYVAGANYGEAYMRNLPQDFVIPDFRMADRPDLYLTWDGVEVTSTGSTYPHPAHSPGVQVSSSVNQVYQDGTGTSSSGGEVGQSTMDSPSGDPLRGGGWKGDIRKDYLPGTKNKIPLESMSNTEAQIPNHAHNMTSSCMTSPTGQNHVTDHAQPYSSSSYFKFGPINRPAPLAHAQSSVHHPHGSPHAMYSPQPASATSPLHQDARGGHSHGMHVQPPPGITVTSSSNSNVLGGHLGGSSPVGPVSGNLVVPQPLKMQRPNKTYHCRMCDQIFDSKSDLLVHSQHVHKQDPKPYKCPTCHKCFANSSYLSQHARIHSGIKPYRCQICERKFTQLCHLQQHTRTHTGEKPYKCQHPGCGKAFTQLSNLQSHSRSHMTDKPYRCNSCYKCFADEMGLRQHIPKHSETKHLKTHICHICGKSYTQETYLTRHMAKHSFDNSNRSGLNKGLPSGATSPSSQHLVSRPHGAHEPLDIKPQIDGNGIATSPDAVSSKPSAFMPLVQQYGGNNMMNSSVPSNFPFPPPRLPYSTLNSPLPHITSVSMSRPFPFAEPMGSRRDAASGLTERMAAGMVSAAGTGRDVAGNSIANSLLSLQQIKNFSSTHSSHGGVPGGGGGGGGGSSLSSFSKSEPNSPVHKDFS